MVTQRTDTLNREGYLSHIYETTGLPTGSGILYWYTLRFHLCGRLLLEITSMLIKAESRC